jgi:hypothetical protein
MQLSSFQLEQIVITFEFHLTWFHLNLIGLFVWLVERILLMAGLF